MSEFFQSGQHPDADMLSAFADGALPAHEREETLLHLAQCADCRSIVYLAQEAVVEASPIAESPSKPAPARRSWFSGWGLTSALAGALGCLILVAVYAPRFIHPKSDFGSDSNISQAQLPASPLPATKSESGPDANTVATPAAPLRMAKSATSAAPAQKALPSQGKTATGLGGAIGAGQGSVAQTLDEKARSSASAPKPVVTGSALAIAASPVAAPPPITINSPQMAEAPVQRSSYGPAQNANQAIDLATVNAQTITSNVVKKRSQLANEQFLLPSHLETVSTVSGGRLVLAIDFAGTLFASQDAGKHWKAISPRWTGHVVKVDLASNDRRQRSAAPVVASFHGAMASTAPQALAQKARAPGSAVGRATLAGVVTDRTGAVVPKATVTVTNAVTAQSFAAQSDGAGSYSVPNLAPGSYRVEAQSPGFKTQTLDAIELTASETLVRNIALDVGSAAQTVTVQADSATLQTEAATLDATAEITNMAVDQPNVFELTTDTGEVWVSKDGHHWKRK